MFIPRAVTRVKNFVLLHIATRRRSCLSTANSGDFEIAFSRNSFLPSTTPLIYPPCYALAHGRSAIEWRHFMFDLKSIMSSRSPISAAVSKLLEPIGFNTLLIRPPRSVYSNRRDNVCLFTRVTLFCSSKQYHMDTLDTRQ